MDKVIMNKSYIIRVYRQGEDTANGTVEDIEQNKRTAFSDAQQLWHLITRTTQEQNTDNVIKPEIFNATG